MLRLVIFGAVFIVVAFVWWASVQYVNRITKDESEDGDTKKQSDDKKN
jgi:hypothetical protein